MLVTIRERQFLGDYKALDHAHTFKALSYWKVQNNSLIYFKLDRYNYKVVGVHDIISIKDN